MLRNYRYENGLDVHEYLDKGMINIAENKKFNWKKEGVAFAKTMGMLMDSVGKDAFFKNRRFSLAMYEFITLGLSRAIENSSKTLGAKFVRERVAKVPMLPEAQRYSGIGVRGTQRLASFVVPMAERFFA